MPDLKTALQEALGAKTIQTTLNAWDAHEDQIRKPQPQENDMANPNPVITLAEGQKSFAVSNNVMRATFDAVKNAPNMQHKEYVDMLGLNGYKSNSVSSVLYQLLRAGQISRNEQGALHVTRSFYAPIKAQPKKKPRVVLLDKAPEQKPRQIVIVKRKRKEEAQGIAALKGDSGEPGLPSVVKAEGEFQIHPSAPVFKAFHPSSIVDNLSVLHARELYDYLRKIFGGN